MKDYDPSKESSYLTYWCVNKLNGWEISQKLPVGSFDWKRTCLELMKNSYRTMNKTGRTDTQLSFLLKRMKINKCGQEDYIIHLRVLKQAMINKCGQENHIIHLRVLKQAMNHELMLEKINRVINFNQEIWLKPYIDMNTVNTDEQFCVWKAYGKG